MPYAVFIGVTTKGHNLWIIKENIVFEETIQLSSILAIPGSISNSREYFSALGIFISISVFHVLIGL